ncbi:hypothetical protein Gotur_024241 [Gossypium turneri]
MFDGTDGHYFHTGSRGHHSVLRYLLSNSRCGWRSISLMGTNLMV